MIKKRFFLLVVLVWCFCSCKGQSEETCVQKFKSIRDFTYGNPDRKSALDSALILTNDIAQCVTIRRAVVDFKISLLLSLQRYQQALNFIDSLNANDFTFGYKKNTIYKSVVALRYDIQGDRIRRDSVYQVISNELEKYIEERRPSDKEFKEIYIDLFAIKGKYLNLNQIDSSVEILKRRYPDKKIFFDFFKVRKDEQ